MFLYHFLDYFFLYFHLALVIFNLFGWIWFKTRKWNLALLLLTGGSWFILGLFYGIGYCPLTDWHWQILNKLGEIDLPYSYMNYIIHRATGVSFNDNIVDKVTGICFFVVLACSVYFNIKDYREKKKHTRVEQ